MQSNKLWCSAFSCSWLLLNHKSCCGNKLAGQACSHMPQRIHACSGAGVGNSFLLAAKMQLLVFTTGTWLSVMVNPIIGPPITKRSN